MLINLYHAYSISLPACYHSSSSVKHQNTVMHEAMNINPQLMGNVKESIKAPNTLYEYFVAIATMQLLYVSKISQ